MKQEFRRRFDCTPRIYVRVPGRVNIIGEHTDYNHLPVLPMAIDRHLELLASPRRDNQWILENLNPDYSRREFSISKTIPPFNPGDWGNYVKAAAQSLASATQSQAHEVVDLPGMNCLINSSIPAAAGLSSSTALVIGVSLAYLALNNQSIDRKRLALQLADAERYVGTRGGSMDHLALLCSTSQHALYIHFSPLELEPIPWNLDCVIILANSRVEAAKSARIRQLYNLRVAESHLATRIVAKITHTTLNRLGQLREISRDPHRHLALLDDFPDGDLDLGTLSHIFDTSEDHLRANLLREFQIESIPPVFRLKRRLDYLLYEWLRVETAVDSIKKGDIDSLGALLYQAHEGMKHDYEVTHPNVDRLVEIAHSCGVKGARVTGAGFGGCVLLLCHPDEVKKVETHLAAQYYKKTPPLLYYVKPSAAAQVSSL